MTEQRKKHHPPIRSRKALCKQAKLGPQTGTGIARHVQPDFQSLGIHSFVSAGSSAKSARMRAEGSDVTPTAFQTALSSACPTRGSTVENAVRRSSGKLSFPPTRSRTRREHKRLASFLPPSFSSPTTAFADLAISTQQP